METFSTEKLSYLFFKGNNILVNFSEQEVVVENEGSGDSTQFKYSTVEFPKTYSRDERVECVIKSRYPTYGSELAAINNGGDDLDEYTSFRNIAKIVADDSINFQLGMDV